MRASASTRPPSRLRRTCRVLGNVLLGASALVFLLGLAGVWFAPDVVEKHASVFGFSFPGILYGIFLRVAGRPRPKDVPPATTGQRVVVTLGALLTIAAPVCVILALYGLVHGGIGVVAFCTLWLGPMLVSAGMRQPPHPEDPAESIGAVLRGGGR